MDARTREVEDEAAMEEIVQQAVALGRLTGVRPVGRALDELLWAQWPPTEYDDHGARMRLRARMRAWRRWRALGGT